MKEIEEIRSYCLNCKNSQCRIKGCPLGNCIPEFIHETDSKKAYEILCNTTILPAICGRICPHEKQCEGSCIRGIKGEPVSIGAMEAYIGDLSIENNYELSIEVDERTKDKRVAVIGSGPAGLTCAAFLARKCVKVTIYEKHDKLGGLLTHGIPEFRLPREVVEKTIEKINKYFIIENVWEYYNPILSDPVKYNFNNEYFSENKSEFISIWLKLFVKYPKDYIEAFISNSYGYYYPEVRNSVVSRVTMDHNMEIKQTPLIEGKWVEQIDGLIDARGIPVFGFVFSIGAGVLLTVIALSYTIYKKKYKYLLVYLPTFILWLTLIASPAYCEYRYAYPIFLALPVYLGMNFIKEGNNEDGKNSSTNTLL